MSHRTIADWAYAILSKRGQPMRYSEIAEVMRRQGYTPTHESKHPAQQLLNSLWTRLSRDSRFAKVGRGVWDLAERRERPDDKNA